MKPSRLALQAALWCCQCVLISSFLSSRGSRGVSTAPGRGLIEPSFSIWHGRTIRTSRTFDGTGSTALGRRSSSQLFTSPEPLASEGDWSAYLDEDSTGLIYYFNGKTGESRWEPPTSSFPVVNLSNSMREKAESKRAEYIKAVEEQLQEDEKGVLSALFAEEEEKEKAVAVAVENETEIKQKEEEPNWFDFLFDDASKKKTGEDAAAFFGSIFDRTRSEEEVDAQPEAAESVAVEEPVEERRTSFLDRVFSKDPMRLVDPAFVQSTLVQEEVEVEEEPALAPIEIEMGSCVLAHPAKIFWGGEDAVLTAGRTFGVFDGVSGAEKLDGLPLYSKTLAKELKNMIGDNGMNIVEITRRLSQAAEIADLSSTGASTAIMASIGNDGFLRALNLGDSGCVVVRNNKIVGRTREVNHFFDCPFQLSVDSPDRPRDGSKLNFELLRGDLIVMASDGVFDNLNDDQIIRVVTSAPKRTATIAKRIADQSRKVSMNRRAETPYAKQAQKNGDPDYTDGLGGKVDDISCVVVRYE